MREKMTPRQRWLAALRLQPVDRLPFWPKLGGAYLPFQSEPWRSRSLEDVHEFVGSDRHEHIGGCVRTVRSKTSTESEERDGVRRVTYKTPVGSLHAEWKRDEASQSQHPVVFPIKTAEDVDLMRLMVEDEHFEFDRDHLEIARLHEREIGQSALAVSSHGVSPLMDWVQHLAGLEGGTYLLYDHRERVEALFEAMHKQRLKSLEILAEHVPADAIYSTENTSTTLISPEMFRRYAQRHLTDYGRIIEASGKLHILHMCGKLKELLPDIAKLPAAAIEAFTSPSVGSTTLLDGRKACPDLCFVGGTNATLWLEPAEVIIETIGRDLDALPHTRGVVVTSAGVMPPLCPPERIKAVADWVKAYPVRT